MQTCCSLLGGGQREEQGLGASGWDSQWPATPWRGLSKREALERKAEKLPLGWDRSVGPANLIPLDGITHYAQVTSTWGLEVDLVLTFSQELGVA